MKKLNWLVCYDVNTASEGGKRRLRRVAKACEAYGQRVQWSVFEITATEPVFHTMMSKVTKAMDETQDSVRVYLLSGERDRILQVFGRDHYVDFDSPLII